MEKFYEIVEEIKAQGDLDTFRIMSEEHKKLIIFGAGDCGHHIYDLLHHASIQVECFCDNKMGGSVDEVTKLNIISPQELDCRCSEVVLLICVVDIDTIESIYNQLLKQGFQNTQIFNMREYFFRVPLSYLQANIEEYKKAYNLLEEDFSRKVYLARMKRAFIVSNIEDVISPREEEYFDEKVKLTEEEVFIDCGGFDGCTSVKFLKKCQGRYKNLVIFEPELCKRASIEKNMSGQQYELYQKGVWSESARLSFNAMGSDASFVTVAESEYTIDVVSLDETVYDKKPTFIKMDIEGSEQEAIIGAEKIIKEYKPKLAVCVYHKPDDLFKLPQMIKRMNPSYQLYLRQYSTSRTETVLYAL